MRAFERSSGPAAGLRALAVCRARIYTASRSRTLERAGGWGRRRVAAVLLCGGLGPGAEIVEASGTFAVVQPIVDRPTDLETAMADTERLLANAAARLARSIGIGRRLGSRGWH